MVDKPGLTVEERAARLLGWVVGIGSKTPSGDVERVFLGALRAAVADERERCAKVAEFADIYWLDGDRRHIVATAIRHPPAPGEGE
jgi:hypothetical protein